MKVQTISGVTEVTDVQLAWLEANGHVRTLPNAAQGYPVYDGLILTFVQLLKTMPHDWEPVATAPVITAGDPPGTVDSGVASTDAAGKFTNTPTVDPPVTATPVPTPAPAATIQDVVNVLERMLNELHKLNTKLEFLDKLK